MTEKQMMNPQIDEFFEEPVLVAGGFGSFIRRSSAQRIGLLPPEIEHQRIRYVGNVSLAGAKTALLSTEARRQSEELARRVKHVDLSTSEGFHEAFAEAMLFPAEGMDHEERRTARI